MKLQQIAIAVDQLVNTILGGYADETMSSRCWRLRAEQPYRTLRWLIDKLLWFDPDHCRTSCISEQRGKQLPSDMKDTNTEKEASS